MRDSKRSRLGHQENLKRKQRFEEILNQPSIIELFGGPKSLRAQVNAIKDQQTKNEIPIPRIIKRPPTRRTAPGNTCPELQRFETILQ